MPSTRRGLRCQVGADVEDFLHPLIGINSYPAVNHKLEFKYRCATPDADKTLDPCLVMAGTCIDLAAKRKSAAGAHLHPVAERLAWK